jgi:hypothetical protein
MLLLVSGNRKCRVGLSFRQVRETGNVELLEPVRLPMPWGLRDFVVNAGFISDGQSAPRGLWWLTGPPIRNAFMACWLGHDHACNHSHTMWERTLADACLAYWLWRAGAGFWKTSGTFWACFTYGRIKFLRRNGWK